MRRVNINIKEFRPHVHYIMRKMRVPNYDVIVAILPLHIAKKIKFAPKEAKGWTACFMPPNIIWMHTNIPRHLPWKMMGILAHELRHYYQFQRKKFDFSKSSTTMFDHTLMSNEDKEMYLNDPREVDAFAFQDRLDKQFNREWNAKKIRFKLWYDNWTII